jgi:diguanylate cyclase (GGDEF)-like protein
MPLAPAPLLHCREPRRSRDFAELGTPCSPGDACLRAIIDPIHTELRQSDVIGRYGGEEFVVILSSADAAAANPIAQRILERVAGVCVDGFGKPIRLTCSIGIAASDTLGVWGEHLIAQADAAVYVAKRRGRNQVQMAAPLAA